MNAHSTLLRAGSPNRSELCISSRQSILTTCRVPGQAPSLPHRKSSAHPPVRTSANLESRLSSLETLLRDVPPNVHNAFLNTLDAQLGSGGSTTSGSKLGVSNPLAGPQSFFDALKAAAGGANIGFANPNLAAGDADLTDVAKRMEGLSFFYEDEIGQAKWQGATSGFPLLELLTAVPQIDEEVERPETGVVNNLDGSPSAMVDSYISPLGSAGASTSTLADATLPAPGFKHPDSPERGRSRSRVRQAPKARFFPDRTPRPCQTLNPEASWKVITNVIPPDLMDTLVRCYVSSIIFPCTVLMAIVIDESLTLAILARSKLPGGEFFSRLPTYADVAEDYANPAKWGEPGFACFVGM